MKLYLILFLGVILSFRCFNQGIKGIVKDENGNAIPYSSVYIHDISKGTITGINGEFEIALEKGNCKISFHSIGYFSYTENIEIKDEWVNKIVTLQTRSYEIEEVIINKSKEDPAYSIMRKAIAMAPYYKNQVSYYDSKLYIKGQMILDKFSKIYSNHTQSRVNDQTIKFKSGDNYILESYNSLKYTAPDKYDQKVISSRNSFPVETDDNFLGYITASLYDPKIEIIVSPLSPQAFTYYRFRYLGYSYAGNYIINKIEVIPRRKGKQVFTGYIYIVDGLWCIHSTDLSNNSIFGDIEVRQIFENVIDNAWLPISYDMNIKISFPGIKSRVKYITSVKYEIVELNKNLPIPAIISINYLPEGKQLKEKETNIVSDKKMEQLLDKEELNKRDMIKMIRLMKKEVKKSDSTNNAVNKETEIKYTIEKDTIVKDTIDWQKIRPIPLENNEISSYQSKDSLKTMPEKEIEPTSNNKTKKSKENICFKYLTGNKYLINKDYTKVKYGGLLKPYIIGFNTVDGFYFNQKFSINQNIDSINKINVNPIFSYAVNRNKFLWEIPVLFEYSQKRNGSFKITAGKRSVDYKGKTGVHPAVNMLSSLFFRENPLKLYNEKFIVISNSINVKKEMPLYIELKYADNQALKNNSEFSFFYSGSKDYTSNEPVNPHNINKNIFADHKSFVALIRTGYTFQTNHENFQPLNLSISYKKGFQGIFNSDVSFDNVEMKIQEKINVGLFTKMDFGIDAGTFLNKSDIYFNDFKHFKTSYLPVSVSDFQNSFSLPLDYYLSTNNSYFSGFYHMETPYILLKYLPYIRNRLWKENIFFNYLYTNETKNYWEVGYALSKIFGFIDLGVFSGFNGLKYNTTALRIDLKLSN